MDQSTNEQQRLTSAGLTEDIRGVMSDIERRLDRLRVAHADREREREELESRSAAVEHKARELDAAATELAERQQEHERAVAAAEARFVELDQREVQAREAFEKAKSEHDAVRNELARQSEQLERDREAFGTEREGFEAERARTHELAEEAAQQVKDVEDDRAALEATAREIDERQKDLDDQASTLAERVREIEQQRQALDARAEQLKQQDQKLANLSREAAEQREKLSGDSSDLEQQKQWLAEQTKQADVLRARVKKLEDELEAAREQLAEASQTQVASAEIDETVAEELELTRGKLRDAAGIIAKLREQADRAGSGGDAQPASPDGEHIRRRQRRLRFVRQTLQQEHAKIAKASELMRQRSAAFVQQGAGGVATHAKTKPAATGPMAAIARMGMGMAGVAVALAVLAGVSWIAAGEIAAPTYAASVTVAHDARGREVLAEDLAGWQAFHESLMDDPRFYEFAADRMRQRGLLELGDAVSVKAFVEGSVSWVSGRDGELMIEVREQGAGRARRVAETLAIALVGQANTARERRPDGLPSVISKEATPDDRPLTNEQPMLAGGVLVGLALVSAALGGLVSRRVKRVRDEVAAEGHTDMNDMGEQHEGRINIG
ncbi:MAG: hypothetical protein NCW75_00755 [Phycisphaera sp.]|nr:MAG: hypothetical protein NCW75_00755 [Phycisphaera sp.]